MKAFISYSHADEDALAKLHAHLSMLKRQGGISDWHDREIIAGERIDSKISQQLERSDVFIALVSPDFLASHYCYEREMQRAMEKCEAGEIDIVPVILEPCDWLESPLKEYKAVPKDGKPISQWTNENAAWLDVVTELRKLVQSKSIENRSGAAPSPTSLSTSETQPKRKVRVKKEFDQVDREDFRHAAFESIRLFFERSCAELNGVEGVRARYEAMSNSAFTCTVVNRLISSSHGTAHITVRTGVDSMLGDVSWSFSPRAGGNTANGGLTVAFDDYHQFLKADFFDFSSERRELSPEEAAQRLWQEFLEKAGISYD